MRARAIQHVVEPPGSIGRALEEAGFTIDRVRVDLGEPVPCDLGKARGLVVMGALPAPAVRARGRFYAGGAAWGSEVALPTYQRTVARAIGRAPSTRNTVSPAMRTHSSVWNVPLREKSSRLACQ